MTDQTPSDVEIRALYGAATPGPWAIDESPGFQHPVRAAGTANAFFPTGVLVADAALDEDAEFIAAARSLVPALLDRAVTAEAAQAAAEARVAALQTKLNEAAAALNVALAHATGQMPYAETPADADQYDEELAGCRIVLDSLAAAPEPATCPGCGNRFDGDNLCLPSACQWEGIEAGPVLSGSTPEPKEKP